jgi:peptidoglycan/LPS O-acetylase OafA/YrhL
LRWTRLTLLVVLVALACVLAWAAVAGVDDWTDWVVFGGILFAVAGFMVAINRRQYPTRKRAFTRDSESRW